MADDRQVDPITQDFLGGSFQTKFIDLDLLNLHVPPGWEKFLDLESGKLYIQRVAPFPDEVQPSYSRAQDKPSLTLALELGVAAKTPSNGLPIHESATYRSGITIEDVRSGLKGFSTSPRSSSKKRPSSTSSVLSPQKFGYDHKCPNCGSVAPMAKKPKVDLNLSI